MSKCTVSTSLLAFSASSKNSATVSFFSSVVIVFSGSLVTSLSFLVPQATKTSDSKQRTPSILTLFLMICPPVHDVYCLIISFF